MFCYCCRRPAAWRATCPKSYYAAVGFFCLCPACVLQTPYKAPRATGQKPGRVLLQLSPLNKPLAAESYFAAVGIFCLCPAHALQAIPRHRKEAGKRVLCSQVPWKAANPKILLRHGRTFLPALCSHLTKQTPAQEKVSSTENLYCAAVGIFARVLLKL